MARRMTSFLLILALAGCGGGEERRGGLSADEERRLDNAARMLDDNMVFDASPEALNEGAPAAPAGNTR